MKSRETIIDHLIRIIMLPLKPKGLARAAVTVNPWLAAGVAVVLRMLFWFALLSIFGADISEPHATVDVYVQELVRVPVRLSLVSLAIGMIMTVPQLIVAISNRTRRFRAVSNGMNLIAVILFPFCITWSLFYLLSSMDANIFTGSPFPGGPVVAAFGSCWVLIALVILWLALIAWMFHRLSHGPELDTNYCPACSYDIRWTRSEGINTCPECGEAITAIADGVQQGIGE